MDISPQMMENGWDLSAKSHSEEEVVVICERPQGLRGTALCSKAQYLSGLQVSIATALPQLGSPSPTLLLL